MKSKIRVHGKSQGRTALGIINAYLKLHPDATPYEVRLVFPKTLNRRCPADNLIIPVNETSGYEKMFFDQEDEQIVFKNGERFALVELWGKEDYDSICERAKLFGIEVAREGAKPFEKGSFELEDIDKCWFRWWWWILLMLVLLLLTIFFWKKCSSDCSQTDVYRIENVKRP